MFKTKEQLILEEFDLGNSPEYIRDTYRFTFGTIYYFLKKNNRQLTGKSADFKQKASNRMKERHMAGLSSKDNHWSVGLMKVRGKYISEIEVMEELQYYIDQDITIKQMSELMCVNQKSITNRLKKFGLQRGIRKGSRHPDWKGGHSKYRGEDWYSQRQKALIRDKYTCQDCGIRQAELDNPQHMHVHHIVPYEKSQDNNLENLITLCVSCHKKNELHL